MLQCCFTLPPKCGIPKDFDVFHLFFLYFLLESFGHAEVQSVGPQCQCIAAGVGYSSVTPKVLKKLKFSEGDEYIQMSVRF